MSERVDYEDFIKYEEDDSNVIYISEDGYFFCCLECALRFYGIHKAEDCMVFNEE